MRRGPKLLRTFAGLIFRVAFGYNPETTLDQYAELKLKTEALWACGYRLWELDAEVRKSQALVPSPEYRDLTAALDNIKPITDHLIDDIYLGRHGISMDDINAELKK